MHGAIATMANLYQRRSSPSPLCPICKAHDESVDHMLLKCPWVEGVWFEGMLSIRAHRQQASNWANWLLLMLELTNGSREVRIMLLSYIAFTCWHIWKSRCDFLFNNLNLNPRRVLDDISLSVSVFKDSIPTSGTSMVPSPRNGDGALPSPRIGEVEVRWAPPNPGTIKINVDASWVASSGMGYTGAVARNSEGGFMAACRYRIRANSVAMAEALAILHGCELGATKGWDSIMVESDSLESISCLRDLARKGSWETFPILRKCSRMESVFQDCRWSWIPRLANLAADLLASRQCKEACDFVWVDRPPSSLIHVLCNDGLPCPP
ncbi:unnamed protein product [Malus baccata var. baccata]